MTKQRGSTRIRKRLMVGGGVLITCALAAGGAGIALASQGGSYRTAIVEPGSVTQTVSTSGTVASAERYDLSFSTAGTVASVSVAVGDRVTAGTALAALDLEELQTAVEEAQSAQAEAEQTLADHLSGQTTTSSSSTSGSSGSGSSGSSGGSGSASTAGSSTTGVVSTTRGTISVAGISAAGIAAAGDSDTIDGTTEPSSGASEIEAAVAKVSAAQQALLDRYSAVTATLDQANLTIVSADAACQPFLRATLADSVDGGTGDAETADAATVETAEDPAALTLEAAQAALSECQAAITEVQSAQQTVSTGQQDVQTLAGELNAAVAELQDIVAAGTDQGAGSGTATPESGAGSGGDRPSDGSGAGTEGGSGNGAGGNAGGSANSSSGTSTSSAVSAEQLLSDQAEIDAAEARVALAEAQLAHSTLTSPIDGVVAQVAMSSGDSVTASSESAVITVIGEGGYVTESTMSLSEVSDLSVGLTAAVSVTSSGTQYTGTVSSIGVLNVSTTTVPAYEVLIALETGEDTLLNGGTARIEIEAASSEGVLTVPTAAVHRDGSSYTVQVLDGGEPVDREVEIGALGSDLTEIVSGLSEGDTVVLADLDAAISADEEDTTSGLSGLGGDTGMAGGGAGNTGGPPSGGMGGPPSGAGIPG